MPLKASVEIEAWTDTITYQGKRYEWSGFFTRCVLPLPSSFHPSASNPTFFPFPSSPPPLPRSDGCIPVRSSVAYPDGRFMVEEFVDVTLGIHDPNIFIPPSNCP